MSDEIKPVYQSRETFCSEWTEVSQEEYTRRLTIEDLYNTRILYPSEAIFALQRRAYSLALVISDLTKIVTHSAETKDQFIERVKAILSVDPDLRVSELQAENAAQAKRIDELEEKLHERTITSGAKFHELNAEIDSLRKQVKILQRPLDDEIISRIIVLVKNVSDEELASGVFESVRNMTNWNKSTPAEFLVLFDEK